MKHEISSKKQSLFDALLDLLAEYDRVCSEYNLKYYAYGGTMLGAVRHKGFIPWDDDIDVTMPRDDYNKLKELAKRGIFKEPYFFQNSETDIGFPRGISRLRNSNTTAIPYDDVAMNCNKGVFLSIFPLDIIPDDDKLARKQIKKLQTIRLFMNSFARYYSGFGAEGTTFVKKIAYHVSVLLFKLKILTVPRLNDAFEKTAACYNHTQNGRVGLITVAFNDKRNTHKRDLFEGNTIWSDFETTKIPIPEHYDKILSHIYGDYMIPVQAPTEHGDMLYSTTVNYKQFQKEHAEELKAGWLAQTETKKK